MEEWKWNPSCSSSDKSTEKPFRGGSGTDSNVTGHLLKEMRPVHILDMFVVTDFWLHLVAQVNKYAASTRVQNDSGSPNNGVASKWFGSAGR